MLTATKFRLYPTTEQVRLFAVQFGCVRFVWNSLLSKIAYKLKRQGGLLVKIDRWFPSTKTCSDCGAIQKGLTHSDRTWVCTACDVTHDRDINAALNIKAVGIVKLKAAGLSVSAHGGCFRLASIAPAAACEVGILRLQT